MELARLLHLILLLDNWVLDISITYTLYIKLDNKYLQLARSQVYAKLHILDGKINTCKYWLQLYTTFIFWVEKQILATSQVLDICRTFYFGWENKCL